MTEVRVIEREHAVERISHAVVEVMRKHLGAALIGLVVQGSAVKGGFIAGCSDIDYILYVEDAALNETNKLPAKLCLAIHRDLSSIDVRPFRYIQCSVLSSETNRYLGPIPGSYRLLAGRLLVPEATDDQIYDDAVRSLNGLNPERAFDTHGLLDHGEDRIERCTRLMCTVVWPVAFQLLTVIHKDGTRVWNLPKQEAVSLLSAVPAVAEEITSFHAAVQSYYPQQDCVEKALQVIRDGMAFLDAAKRCWESIR